jgi:hypothetical protein
MHTEAGAAIQNHSSSDVINLSKSQQGTNTDVKEQQNTIFRSCLESHHLDADEKKLNRLAQEAFTIIVAGGETTARVLTTATFYMVEHKERIIPRLHDELHSISSDLSEELSLKALEQLPWLVSHLTSKCKSSPNRCTSLPSSKSPCVLPPWSHLDYHSFHLTVPYITESG